MWILVYFVYNEGLQNADEFQIELNKNKLL
jgi:hypothetical protein